MSLVLVTAQPVHIGPIATRMRTDDRLECRAYGLTPKQALRSGLRSSLVALSVMIEGRAQAMLGLAPVSLIEGVGRPWMLATDALYREGRAWVTIGPQIVAAFLRITPRLENVIAADNHRAIRMIERLGFEIGQGSEIGGVRFVEFSAAADVHSASIPRCSHHHPTASPDLGCQQKPAVRRTPENCLGQAP